MPVKINTGKNKGATTAPQVEAQQEVNELTLEETLVAAIGADTIEKAAHLASQMEDLKAQMDSLESDYKPLAAKIQAELAACPELKPTKKLVLETESGATCNVAALRKSTTIKDKEKLYHALEAKQEGLYFDLSKIGITDAKNYVPVEGNPEIFESAYGKTRGLKFKF